MRQQYSKKRYLFILLGVYLAALVYLMFFGYGRPQLAAIQEYRYSLIPVRIPLWLPNQFSLDTIKLWIFTLGNLLAFIPFGILVPMAIKKYSKSYFQFIALFIFFIFSLEILQMVTYLGSFDVEDIIINTMSSTIGYVTYKVGERMNSSKNKYLVSMGLSIIILSTLTFLLAWAFNNTITPYLYETFGLYLISIFD